MLRCYRKELIMNEEFNNFKSKRIEKIINLNENFSISYIDFSKFENLDTNFSLVFYKKDLVLEENLQNNEKMESENENLQNNVNLENILQNSSTPVTNNETVTNLNSNSNTNLNYLKNLSEEYLNHLQIFYKDKIIKTEDITNIDILRYKVDNDYYITINHFLKDVNFMFKSIYENLNTLLQNPSDMAKAYLTSLYLEFIKNIYEVKVEFKESFNRDITEILNNNKLPKTSSPFQNIPCRKAYQVIDDYEHTFPKITKPKTKTALKPGCSGDCCKTFEDVGPLNLEKMNWDSKCTDRHNNLECDDSCGCGSECKNRAIVDRNHKTLLRDVIEKYAWGIDLWTYRNLMEFLPLNFSDNFKSENYIENTLVKSLSFLNTEGNNIPKALKYIIEKNECFNNFLEFSNFDLFFSQHLLDVFTYSKPSRLTFSASSKGIGIFCQKKEGIKKNEFITGYYGEIYPPWYWFEKQDLIKKNKLDSELPDFYNIMLERLKGDENGYDLVMVDPNSKGNFSSRMSHSCIPNCNTVLMASNSEYTIGMFATKDIEYGQELTFDYNSVTEKEKEFQDAICLCSSFNCRGHYLIYSNSLIFTEVLSKYHSFLDRNALLFNACNAQAELEKQKMPLRLPEEDLAILKKYSIGESILNRAPFWLKKWASLVLKFIEFEINILPNILSGNQNKNGNNIKKIDFSQVVIKDTKINIETKDILPKIIKEKKDNLNNNIKKHYNPYYDKFVWGAKKYTSSTRNKIINDDGKVPVTPKVFFEEISEYIENSNGLLKEKENEKNEIMEDLVDGFKEIQENDKMEVEVEVNEKKENEDMNLDTSIKIENGHEDKKENDEANELKEKYKFEINAITDNRLQNLAITIDKVIHVLDLMKTINPPLAKLNKKEVYDFYWENKDCSLRNVLLLNFKRLLTDSEFVQISTTLTENIQMIISLLKDHKSKFAVTSNQNGLINNSEYDTKIKECKEIFRLIISMLRECIKLDKTKNFVNYEGLADILFLHYNTNTYFKHNKDYERSVESEKIIIRQRDINTADVVKINDTKELDLEGLNQKVYEGKKIYDKMYIWGQLIGWFKQTVDKPNASLSAERRGSLAYPDLDSFFITDRMKPTNIFNYPFSSRNNFYTKILENPSLMWPVGNDWSFKNKLK